MGCVRQQARSFLPEAGEPQPMKQIVLNVAIPYEVEFIRRGCQNTEGLVVWDEGSVVIVEAPPSETDVAFSIVPIGVSGRAYDILAFDDKIWWPLRDGSKTLSVETFVWSIGNPSGLFLATLNLSPATLHSTREVTKSRFDADHSIREEEVSSRDQRWTLAHRSAARLLFCDGAVYQEGSAPAYFGTWRTAAGVPTLSLRIGRQLVDGSQAVDRWHPGVSSDRRRRAVQGSLMFSIKDIDEACVMLREEGINVVVEETAKISPVFVLQSSPPLSPEEDEVMDDWLSSQV
jgi:hypothetical protein